MLRRIHHAAIICSDYAASKRFYAEYTGKRFVFLSDPDGLPLELYEK